MSAPEWGKCQRPDCRGGAARAPWFSCPDPEGDCTVEPEADAGPLTFPPEWSKPLTVPAPVVSAELARLIAEQEEDAAAVHWKPQWPLPLLDEWVPIVPLNEIEELMMTNGVSGKRRVAPIQSGRKLRRAPGTVPHGTSSKYTTGKCRCQECLAANRAAKLANARVRGIPPRPVARHGTITYYVRYKCRCEPCRAAYSAYRVTLKARAAREEIAR